MAFSVKWRRGSEGRQKGDCEVAWKRTRMVAASLSSRATSTKMRGSPVREKEAKVIRPTICFQFNQAQETNRILQRGPSIKESPCASEARFAYCSRQRVSGVRDLNLDDATPQATQVPNMPRAKGPSTFSPYRVKRCPPHKHHASLEEVSFITWKIANDCMPGCSRNVKQWRGMASNGLPGMDG